MSTEINKAKVLSGLFWKLMERGGTQGVQFVVQIVLARLLLPADYGIIALVTIFITIAGIFVQSGFNTALIQKKDANETDFSSVFYLSLFIAVILYTIIFFTSPAIAAFYGEPQLILVFRILSVILVFGALNTVQNAVVARNMQFKKLFMSSLGAILVSGSVGIVMAYKGFGVWALVVQQMTNQLLISVILWFTVKWRPGLLFSAARVKELFNFSWKLLISTLINNLCMDLRSILIAKLYNAEMLGFYNKGKQLPHLITANVNGSIQSVMLPTLSKHQDNKKRVKEMVRRSIITSSFVLFPLMTGMAVVSEPLVKILLTEKWIPCVPFLQIHCVTYALWSIHTANLQAINAIGRSDIFLKLEIVKNTLNLAVLGATLFFGIYAIALGGMAVGIVSAFINAYPNIKLLDYGIKEQWKDIKPSILLSIVMGIVIYSIRFFELSAWLTLSLQVFTGLIVYMGMAKVYKVECFDYIVITIKQTINRKRKESI